MFTDGVISRTSRHQNPYQLHRLGLPNLAFPLLANMSFAKRAAHTIALPNLSLCIRIRLALSTFCVGSSDENPHPILFWLVWRVDGFRCRLLNNLYRGLVVCVRSFPLDALSFFARHVSTCLRWSCHSLSS